METLNLLLKRQRDEHILALLIGPGLQTSFTVSQHKRLDQQYEAWLRRFIAHHDPSGIEVPAHVLQHYRDQLCKELNSWLLSPEWSDLQTALAAHPQIPIQLEIDASLPSLIRLPWESWIPDRQLWRTQQIQGQIDTKGTPSRKPRLLLLVGDEGKLDLTSELDRLEALRRSGRIALTVLRGKACSSEAIRSALAQSPGWDALLFLGHSEADPSNGGRLHLGDHSWIAAQSLDQDLKQASTRGLKLVLLNSCSGLDWANRALQFGVNWAVCFREVVPSAAAATTFQQILLALEKGSDLITAVEEARVTLLRIGDSSSALLLSALGHKVAEPFQLPLRKRRQFLLRLKNSTKSQAIAAAMVTAIGLITDVVPWNPINQGLLNQRLRLQRVYRDITHQPGPKTSALPVLLLGKRRAYPELGVLVAPETSRISRVALQEVLRRASPQNIPRIGLDAILDEPAVEPAATQQLAELIKQQKRPELFAGYYGSTSDGPGAGSFSKPVPVLASVGLRAYDLAINTDPGWWSDTRQRQVPLQLKAAITNSFFSHAVAGNPSAVMPTDAVIDWSLDWQRMLHRIHPDQLSRLQTPVLLVGNDGQMSLEQPDLFNPPSAALDALVEWQLPTNSLPGAMVQGVLAQSLRMGHWLMPSSTAMTSLLSAGIGVLAAAGMQKKNRRIVLLLIAASIFTVLCFQWAAAIKLLIPIFIPAAALFSTALVRHD